MGRTPALSAEISEKRLILLQNLDAGWIAAFAIGFCSSFTVHVLGQLFVSEGLSLYLLPCLIYERALHRNDDTHQRHWMVVRHLLLALSVTFTGYLLSDLYRNTSPDDYARGWSRLAFLAIDISTVALLVRRDPANLIAIAWGMGFGGLVSCIASGTPLSAWKLAYAEPVTILGTLLASMLRGRAAAFVALSCLGLLNIALDYRSLGAMCLIAGAALYLNHWAAQRRLDIGRITFVSLLTAAVLAGGYAYAKGRYFERQVASNSGRTASILIGLKAITDSPLIGFGSWSKNPEYARQYSEMFYRLSRVDTDALYNADPVRLAQIPAHSQILQSWIEAGMLGVIFFLVYLWYLASSVAALLLRGVSIGPVALTTLFLVDGIWALFFSPFLGTNRILIAVASVSAAMVTQAHREQKPPEES